MFETQNVLKVALDEVSSYVMVQVMSFVRGLCVRCHLVGDVTGAHFSNCHCLKLVEISHHGRW